MLTSIYFDTCGETPPALDCCCTSRYGGQRQPERGPSGYELDRYGNPMRLDATSSLEPRPLALGMGGPLGGPEDLIKPPQMGLLPTPLPSEGAVAPVPGPPIEVPPATGERKESTECVYGDMTPVSRTCVHALQWQSPR